LGQGCLGRAFHLPRRFFPLFTAGHFRKVQFHADNIHKGYSARIIEGGEQIDIGIRPASPRAVDPNSDRRIIPAAAVAVRGA
jgi:hypothetical protein